MDPSRTVSIQGRGTAGGRRGRGRGRRSPTQTTLHQPSGASPSDGPSRTYSADSHRHTPSPNVASTPDISSHASPSGGAQLDDIPFVGKVFLMPEGSGNTAGFIPSKQGVEYITGIMKTFLDCPYKNWMDILTPVQNLWFREWTLIYHNW